MKVFLLTLSTTKAPLLFQSEAFGFVRLVYCPNLFFGYGRIAIQDYLSFASEVLCPILQRIRYIAVLHSACVICFLCYFLQPKKVDFYYKFAILKSCVRFEFFHFVVVSFCWYKHKE